MRTQKLEFPSAQNPELLKRFSFKKKIKKTGVDKYTVLHHYIKQ